MGKSTPSVSLPLNERVILKNSMQRAIDLIILFLLLSLLVHRLLVINDHGLAWAVAFFCELCFTFVWVLTLNAKWNPVENKTYPERLLRRVSALPALDLLVTTADPALEPPIITMNTVLSLVALDYPAHKLACYLSDDGGSALIFYSFVETSKFAKLWVPFCKKYGVRVRAPFRYFAAPEDNYLGDASTQLFQQERATIKGEYEKLVKKIEDATKKATSYDGLELFLNIERDNHPSIIQVVYENKDDGSDGLPHMIYVSREKRPKHHHHYKAGAMNVITRVSGLMTNAPFILNVDCDMYAHNPQLALQAMCLLLGPKEEADNAFVQAPQSFYNGPWEALTVLQKYLLRGIDGVQGPYYCGSGCVHRRKVLYASRPEDMDTKARDQSLCPKELRKRFGGSVELSDSVARTLTSSKEPSLYPKNGRLSNLVDAACQVAACGYEYGTCWGNGVGWRYGSTAEDVLTGISIHAMGWRSVFNAPDPPAFYGCAPSDGPTALLQQKRWATGLSEILFVRGHNNPFSATISGKLQFRQCVCYMWILVWALRAIPELCYALLPAYCVITNSRFLPKGLAVCLPLAVFVIYNLYTLSEYLRTGASVLAWWGAQKMQRITAVTAWLFGFFGVVTKLLGLSVPVFEITRKQPIEKETPKQVDQSTIISQSQGNGGLNFDESPLFVPATVVALVHLTALAMAVSGFQPPPSHGRAGSGWGEIACVVLVLHCFWPFVEGLFKRGRHGIPASTICKSAALSLLFVRCCKWTSMV